MEANLFWTPKNTKFIFHIFAPDINSIDLPTEIFAIGSSFLVFCHKWLIDFNSVIAILETGCDQASIRGSQSQSLPVLRNRWTIILHNSIVGIEKGLVLIGDIGFLKFGNI